MHQHKAFRQTFNLAKYFVGQNSHRTKLFVRHNFRQFCPKFFCPIRYFKSKKSTHKPNKKNITQTKYLFGVSFKSILRIPFSSSETNVLMFLVKLEDDGDFNIRWGVKHR